MVKMNNYIVVEPGGSTIGPFDDFEKADAWRLANVRDGYVRVLWSPKEVWQMLL
jgi:hypothetical protein